MNFEVTTECPLGCSQCYCTLNRGKHLDKNTAYYWIDQAAENKVSTLNLSGGETLCYPYLFDVIKYASSYGININIAISGLFFDQHALEQLIYSGVGRIFVSLNGSTKMINDKSRNGYALAISAIELMQKNEYPRATVNWVMQNSNADDFENLVYFLEEKNVNQVVVIALKPDSSNELNNLPSLEQMKNVVRVIRNYHGSVNIGIESCYSPLLALYYDSFLFGNQNKGLYKGCQAGLTAVNLSVDGLLSPCRHIYYYEKWKSLKDYWDHSDVLRIIRSSNRRKPCLNCKYDKYCRHCVAINTNLNKDIFWGDVRCPIGTL